MLAQHCEIDWHGFYSNRLRYTICSWNTSGFEALQSLPIAKRAWVVQERLLAPRVLHFGADQLFWECKDVILASESLPFGIPLNIADYYGRRAFTTGPPSDRPRRTSDGHTISPSSPWEPWQSIVKEYTSCSLTYPDKDKFSALAGIAERQAEGRDDQFVVGFFRPDILWDIVWYVKPENSTLTKRTLKGRAPTWSWASVDGPIHFRMRWGGRSTLVARLKGITLDRSNNIYSGLQTGAIEIESFLFPAVCMRVIRKNGKEAVELVDPPSDTAGYLKPHWSWFLLFDDQCSIKQEKMRIDLLRIESEPTGPEAGLILRWNDVHKAYNRLGMFLADSDAAEQLRINSITLDSVEIE
ncbi:hypothetical protein H2200_005105 [Cladophialophora chaetospira]|uniref:Heterokaryon incompatibility domain-containing protein n=1 Tax=Cladophialophora chaetospira TaxID=386627 RepID=A0AA38XBC3_9EURO|nr:hypothetical protein H2200_005105 [Cladophialophora chaetospira]